MNLQPDNFFRKKLEGYTKPAPVTAWDKIEASLNKKKHKHLWLKIAASIILLAAAAWLLWQSAEQPGHRPTTIAHHAPEKTEPIKEAQDSGIPDTSTQNKNISVTPPVKEKEKPHRITHTVKEKDFKKRKTEVTPHQETVAKTVTHEAHETPETQTLSPNIDIQPDASAVVAESNIPETVQSKENITLIVTAAEADEYLDKEALAEATIDNKKPSTLKKLLKKAAELKNNQDPFGELRQKKNEILALNFKGGKQREQNK